MAAPLFDLLRRYPEFLAVHGVGGAEIASVVALSLLPLPLAMYLVEWVAGRISTSAAAAAHVLWLFVWTALIALPPCGRVAWLPGVWPLVVASVLGIAGAMAYLRLRAVRELLVWGIVALPAFVLIFVLDPSIRRIAAPGDVASHAAVQRSETPIVLVVFDALPTTSLLDRELQIDRIRYPNLARFASEATWYRQNTTVSYETLSSVSAVLDGRYPEAERHSILADHPQNLFTISFDTHAQHVLEPLTRLCPRRRVGGEFRLAESSHSLFLRDTAVVLAQLFAPPAYRDRLPPLDRDWKGFADDSERHEFEAHRKVAAFRAFVAEMAPTEKPALHVIHTVLPHNPFRYFPSGRTYSRRGDDPSGAQNWGVWKGMEWAILHNQQRHILQLRYVDSLLGDLVARLRDLAIYDDAVIVLTADHGAAFRVGDQRRGISDENRHEILAVPLLIKRPGQREGAVSDLPSESIDVLPTIAELAGLSLEIPVDGVSLVGDAAAGRKHKRQSFRSPVVFPTDALGPLATIVERNFERFGDGGHDRIWSFGPHGDLVGRELSSLEISGTQSCLIELREPERFDAVDLSKEPLPCELYGELSCDENSGVHALAIALNGEIVATTQTYRTKRDEPRPLWSALLPEQSLRAGKNELKIYFIGTDAAGGRVLSPAY